jgi:hypothetical protein
VGAEFYTGGYTDMQQTVALRNFANESKISAIYLPVSIRPPVSVAVTQYVQTAYRVQSPLPLQYEANTDGLTPEIMSGNCRNASVKCLAGDRERHVQIHILVFFRT